MYGKPPLPGGSGAVARCLQEDARAVEQAAQVRVHLHHSSFVCPTMMLMGAELPVCWRQPLASLNVMYLGLTSADLT